jgi:pyruvate/2-oxoglutarate dehydrogenase complex dihydrolipoamide acyltransferase (E2) component
MPRIRHGTPRRSYKVGPLPAGRLQVIQLLAAVAGQHTVHGLIEADVTEPLERLRSQPSAPTVTAYVVAAVAQTVREHPEVNCRRAGRKLVAFDDVDIIVTVERGSGAESAPVPVAVRRADTKSVMHITTELRHRKAPAARSRPSHRLLSRAPLPVVRAAVAVAGTVTAVAASWGPPVGVSSLGMFGVGWAIPISPLTVMVTVGGVTRRPALIHGSLTERSYLPLTLSFDHTVIDGAPAARFAATLVRTLEAGGPAGDPRRLR